MSGSTAVVNFEGIQPESIHLLKELNSVIFPVRYQESLYKDVLKCGDVTQLAMLDGKCIGGIACRLQMMPDGFAKLYILTLGVLDGYRNQGLGAIRFYEQHGFSTVRVQRGYYTNLTPGDAVLLQKQIQEISTHEMADLSSLEYHR